MADRVAVMSGGRIEQVGTPDEIYDHPASPFVYDFLGNVNLFHGRVDDGTTHIEPEATEHSSSSVRTPSTSTRHPTGPNSSAHVPITSMRPVRS